MKEDIWMVLDFKGTDHAHTAGKPFGQGLQTNQLKPEASVITILIRKSGRTCQGQMLSVLACLAHPYCS